MGGFIAVRRKQAVGLVTRERLGATHYPVPYGPRLTTEIDFSIKTTAREPPGLIRTFHSLQPGGSRRTAINVDGIGLPVAAI